MFAEQRFYRVKCPGHQENLYQDICVPDAGRVRSNGGVLRPIPIGKKILFTISAEQAIVDLALYRYQAGGWQSELTSSASALPPSLRVVTQNLWFDSLRREDRMAGLVAVWESQRPDIIAVQEATLAMLRPLLSSPWLREHYWCTASPESPATSHGVVFLTRLRPERAWLTALPGSMGRRLVSLQFPGLRVASVHLESTRTASAVRSEQLDTIFPLLGPSATLMGDFNFCSSSAENAALPAEYRDLWPVLHPHEPGPTLDSSVNTMLWKATRAAYSSRYDRILLRSPDWRARSIERLGMEPLGPDLFCSDHFGLLADLQRS